jgi:hypothetical protein
MYDVLRVFVVFGVNDLFTGSFSAPLGNSQIALFDSAFLCYSLNNSSVPE